MFQEGLREINKIWNLISPLPSAVVDCFIGSYFMAIRDLTSQTEAKGLTNQDNGWDSSYKIGTI